MRITESGSAKLLLFGEHAAVYGFPSVGIPLPWSLSVTLSPSRSHTWSFPQVPAQFLKILAAVFPEIQGGEFTIESGIPIGIGLGSSGALCAAIARCLFSYLRPESLSNEAIWAKAHEMEKFFHSTPSGIDTALSIFRQACSFKGIEGQLPECTPFPMPAMPLILGAVPRESNTGEIIAYIRRQKKQDGQASSLIEELGIISRQAIDHLHKPGGEYLKTLGNLAKESHERLKRLSLSTTGIDRMIEHGLSRGALGGKLSGAGGGGAYFLITESELQANEIVKSLIIFAQSNKIEHLLLAPLSQVFYPGNRVNLPLSVFPFSNILFH